MKITLEDIYELIEEPYLSRGKEYFRDGLVKMITVKAELVKARVSGTSIYAVRLTLKNNLLQGHCSCPAFCDFGPCKHMAATCFALLYGVSDIDNRDAKERFDEYGCMERYLNKHKKSELIEIILSMIARYPEIMEEYNFYNE